MSITIAEEKALLRIHIRAQLSAMPINVRRAEDELLFSAFLTTAEETCAKTVFLFCGTGTEPDTARLFAPLLARGKRICLPRMLSGRGMEARQYCPDRSLIRHSFGILEPDERCARIDPEEIDLVLVPALCYDRKGFRLGMGGGYYDRWLAHYHGLTVGFCRQTVLQDKLPAEKHDRPVDMVITPYEIVHAK